MGSSRNRSNQERLLDIIPPERRNTLARALANHTLDDDDPILLLIYEVMVTQKRAISEEFKKQHRLLQAIYQPRTWKKLLLSRFVSWILAPVVMAGVFLYALQTMRTDATESLRKVLKDPDAFARWAEISTTAIDSGNQSAKSIYAVANLLNVPNARAAIIDDHLVIVVPNQEIQVTPGEKETTLRFDSNPRIFKDSIGGTSMPNKLEATEAAKPKDLEGAAKP